MNATKISTSDARQLSESAIHWANTAIEKTTLTQSHFAELLAESDDESVFFKAVTKFTPISQGQKNIACNLKKVQRYLDYSSPLPADLLVKWAESLPAPYRQYMKNDCVEFFTPHKIDEHELLVCIKEMSEGITALSSGNKDAMRKELAEARDAINAVLGDA